VGPTLGGLVIGAAGWRAVFYANVPIVLVALVLFVRAVPRRRTERPAVPFDLLGSVLLSVVLGGAAGLVLEGRGSVAAWVVAVGGIALLAAFAYLIRHELRHPDPVIHPRLFLIRTFAAATSGVAFNNLSLYTTLLAAPLLLTDRFGWTSAETGLGLTALTVPSFLLSAVGGRLADRAGRRLPAVLGNAIAAAGLLPLLFGAADRPAGLIGCLSVAGIGFGLSVAAMQTSAVEAVEAGEAGVASGLYSTSRYIGSIVGSVALGALLTARPGHVGGFREVAVLVIVSAVAATLVSFGLAGGTRRRALAAPPAVPGSELR
jgi:DHA2 family methylenomycin A resistance protein-like MFS transporter